MVAGELVLTIGDESGLVRANLAHKVHQVVEGVALDVVFGSRPIAHQRGQVVHILGPDVAGVRPGVHGEALSTGLQRLARQSDHIGYRQVAGVAQQRDLVDVDRQRSAKRSGLCFWGDERVHGEPVAVRAEDGAVSISRRTSSIICLVRKGGDPR